MESLIADERAVINPNIFFRSKVQSVSVFTPLVLMILIFSNDNRSMKMITQLLELHPGLNVGKDLFPIIVAS